MRNRPVGDALLLTLGFTVAFILCVEILLVAAIALFNIDVDASRLTSSLTTSTQIILGAVLGYATGSTVKRNKPPDDDT